MGDPWDLRKENRTEWNKIRLGRVAYEPAYLDAGKHGRILDFHLSEVIDCYSNCMLEK